MKEKKSIVGRLSAAAVALTLVTTCLMGGTLAKYTTTVSGTGAADVAAWKIAFAHDSDAKTSDYTFTLADTGTNKTNVTANKVAPGSTGSFVVSIDGAGTEVAFDYTIKIDTANLNGVPIKFYSDQSMTNEIPSNGLTDSVTVDAASKKKEQTIYWAWDTTSTDTADTAIGTAEGTSDGSKTGTFTVKLTATQAVK